MPQSDTFSHTVTSAHAGRRLDRFLVERHHAHSRAHLQRLIEEGRVLVNGRRARASYRLRAGETVSLEIPPPVPLEVPPEAIALDVLYEDDHLIVVNKPPGLVVHPSAGHRTGTLVNALLYHCRDLSGIGGVERPGIVHRLDKDTSGALVVAKTDQAHRSLARQFKTHTVTKVYQALVRGIPEPRAGLIRLPIGRHPTARKKMSTRATRTREAESRYQVVEALPGASLLEVRLTTGRTHQIRVHLASLHYPVLGDRMYGGVQRLGEIVFPRQMLHAAVLGFIHPVTGNGVECRAPLPEDMKEALEALREHKHGESVNACLPAGRGESVNG